MEAAGVVAGGQKYDSFDAAARNYGQEVEVKETKETGDRFAVRNMNSTGDTSLLAEFRTLIRIYTRLFYDHTTNVVIDALCCDELGGW